MAVETAPPPGSKISQPQLPTEAQQPAIRQQVLQRQFSQVPEVPQAAPYLQIPQAAAAFPPQVSPLISQPQMFQPASQSQQLALQGAPQALPSQDVLNAPLPPEILQQLQLQAFNQHQMQMPPVVELQAGTSFGGGVKFEPPINPLTGGKSMKRSQFHKEMDYEVRRHVVWLVATTIVPNANVRIVNERCFRELAQFCRKMEFKAFREAHDKKSYIKSLAKKLHKLETELVAASIERKPAPSEESEEISEDSDSDSDSDETYNVEVKSEYLIPQNNWKRTTASGRPAPGQNSGQLMIGGQQPVTGQPMVRYYGQQPAVYQMQPGQVQMQPMQLQIQPGQVQTQMVSPGQVLMQPVQYHKQTAQVQPSMVSPDQVSMQPAEMQIQPMQYQMQPGPVQIQTVQPDLVQVQPTQAQMQLVKPQTQLQPAHFDLTPNSTGEIHLPNGMTIPDIPLPLLPAPKLPDFVAELMDADEQAALMQEQLIQQ
ncbi:hypothetical protein L596_030507 [Steinernema carpocapsae]|uniref:KIX domain-containing protein n=1 Tax=Steinernema carpocapsae TaxID=34508 RepID=A0A4U5LPK6_STECR|nr:hypothetical protein L596_030507 [Steinernema carpocapsae]